MSGCSKVKFSSPSNWQTHTHTHSHTHTDILYYPHSLQCSVCLLRTDSNIGSALHFMCWGSYFFVNFLYEGQKKSRRLKKNWSFVIQTFSAPLCPLMCIQHFFLQSVCPAFIPLSSKSSKDYAYVCRCLRTCKVKEFAMPFSVFGSSIC